MSAPSNTKQATTFAFADDRAVRLVVDLLCPRCGTAFKADDVGADRISVVLVCSVCRCNVLTVSQLGRP